MTILPNAILPALTTEEEVAQLLAPERIGPLDGDGRLSVVAMSGGVDSAVTALIMRERGYRVVGINLRLFSPDDPDHRLNPCCGIPAMDDARATCDRIGVPFYALNMESEFSEAVIERFVEGYVSGRTPNPCLECNRHVKFRHLVQRARELGADCLATGHYARIAPGKPHRLLKAVDQRKDQSYVLYTLNQEQLGFIQFPLGNLTKPEVRTLARHFGLPVADKPESQEICFVGSGSYADFVAKRRPAAVVPGEIVSSAGDVIGRHDGLLHHTVGQRRGIGIAAAEPLYVLRLEPVANRLVVGSQDEAGADSLHARDVSMISGMWQHGPLNCVVSVRYRGAPHVAELSLVDAATRTAVVRFTGKRPIAAPGQAIVFYSEEELLGGGTIDRVELAATQQSARAG